MQAIGNTICSFTNYSMEALNKLPFSTFFPCMGNAIVSSAKLAVIAPPMLLALNAHEEERGNVYATSLCKRVIGRIPASFAISVLLTWVIDTRCAFRSLDWGNLLVLSTVSVADSFCTVGVLVPVATAVYTDFEQQELLALHTKGELTKKAYEQEVDRVTSLTPSGFLVGGSLLALGATWGTYRLFDIVITNGKFSLALAKGDVNYVLEVGAHLVELGRPFFEAGFEAGRFLFEVGSCCVAWLESIPMQT